MTHYTSSVELACNESHYDFISLGETHHQSWPWLADGEVGEWEWAEHDIATGH